MSKKKDVTITPNGDAVYTPGAGDSAVSSGAAAANGKATPLSPRERFRRYAEKRVNVAIKKLKYVQNMGSRASYEYTGEEATAIVLALEKAVEDIRRAFTGSVEKRAVFTLF